MIEVEFIQVAQHLCGHVVGFFEIPFFWNELIQDHIINLQDDFLVLQHIRVQSSLDDQEGVSVGIVYDATGFTRCPSPLL